jgi:antitoxin YefM
MYQVTVDYAKDHLDELCDRTKQEQTGIKINRGDQNFVLLTQEEWETLVETAQWLQIPNITADINKARREYANQETASMDQVFGI